MSLSNKGPFFITNTLTRKKEEFVPIDPPHVGLYVCGPTVYSDVHLGNVRSFLTFDVLYRWLTHLGYNVRYVRNITDVGHLVGDVDEGEDKIAKRARLERLEPMELVHKYTVGFHKVMDVFNIISPSIEPTATGHLIEQIEMVKRIIDNGFAYEVNGSVYFDVPKFAEKHNYGELSGRKIDELVSNTRGTEGMDEKRSPLDFAIWKKADKGHIMKWPSPWGEGFPGWHLECTAMSSKYLGKQFDIHGGGMDLLFPHHECELAQGNASNHIDPAKYWMHNNMITINGQKMGKSLGNFITLQQLFSGDHEMLRQAYSPMPVRYFILTAHYRSTLDFSNEALLAAQKGYKKIINGLRIAKNLRYEPKNGSKVDAEQTAEVVKNIENASRAMSDDFNTAQCIGYLFNLLKKINSIYTGQLDAGALGPDVFHDMIQSYQTMVEDVLGLIEEKPEDSTAMLETLLGLYAQAKQARDYDKVDAIRASLKSQGILVKDMRDKIDWAYEE